MWTIRKAAMGTLLVTGCLLLASPQSVDAQIQTTSDGADVTVDPPEIRAGMFFDGASVTVSALVPEGLEISISCVGNREPVTLNQKGKALGLIWMNVGEVEIDGAPDVYLLNTSRELGEMADAETLENLSVGYSALQAESEFSASTTPTLGESLFQDFLTLKESDGLYAVGVGEVEMEEEGAGLVRVTTSLRLSPKTPPGEYTILVHGFGGEEGTLLATAPLQLRQVGMAEFIRNLAMEHGLLYGLVAVVVAICVGLVTGVLFGLGSRKAH